LRRLSVIGSWTETGWFGTRAGDEEVDRDGNRTTDETALRDTETSESLAASSSISESLDS